MILQCVFWVAGWAAQIEKIPIESGVAYLQKDQNGYSFMVDVIEERLNSIVIEQKNNQMKAHVYSMQYPQNQLSAVLEIRDQRATADCEIKNSELKNKLKNESGVY